MTKLDLYRRISGLRRDLGITESSYPVDIHALIVRHYPHICIDYDYFDTKGLYGIAMITDDSSGKDVIILNKARDEVQQRHDCAHELMHTLHHRNEMTRTFNCLEGGHLKQNTYIEWEANEGASELLVPAKLLIPEIAKMYTDEMDYLDFVEMRFALAWKFKVSAAVIAMRYESLRYEIDQGDCVAIP